MKSSNEAIWQKIAAIGILPVIRSRSVDEALLVAEALLEGGIAVAEITLSVPGAPGVISELARRFGEALLVGAGSVLDLASGRRCLEAGAQFLVSPGLVLETIELAARAGALAIPGALTPSEVLMARAAGARAIKIFPCSAVGGADYLRALAAPIPDVAFVATGGVTLETLASFVDAGARAVGAGGALVSGSSVEVTARGRAWVKALAEAREKVSV